MTLTRATGVILAKELRTEFRSRELLGTTVVFVLIVIVLFSFTFNPTAAESRRFGPGLLWLAFLFAGSLMLQSSFLRQSSYSAWASSVNTLGTFTKRSKAGRYSRSKKLQGLAQLLA